MKKADICLLLDSSLNEFIRMFDLEVGAVAAWSRYEDFVKGEEYLDSIPDHVIIQDTYFKKVYNSQGVEFVNNKNAPEPTVSLKNFIVNRAIEKVSPLIAEELANVKSLLLESNKLDFLKKNIKVVDDLFNYDYIVMGLNDFEKRYLMDWVFNKFCSKSVNM